LRPADEHRVPKTARRGQSALRWRPGITATDRAGTLGSDQARNECSERTARGRAQGASPDRPSVRWWSALRRFSGFSTKASRRTICRSRLLSQDRTLRGNPARHKALVRECHNSRDREPSSHPGYNGHPKRNRRRQRELPLHRWPQPGESGASRGRRFPAPADSPLSHLRTPRD
jgi:hypothetical protein